MVSYFITISNLSSFTELEDSYIKFLSMVASIINISVLTLFTYFGTALLNLPLPKTKLPWSESCHKLSLLYNLFRLLLVVTFKATWQCHITLYFNPTNLIDPPLPIIPPHFPLVKPESSHIQVDTHVLRHLPAFYLVLFGYPFLPSTVILYIRAHL